MMKHLLLLALAMMVAGLLGGCILVDRDHDRGRRDYDDHDRGHYDHDYDHHDYR